MGVKNVREQRYGKMDGGDEKENENENGKVVKASGTDKRERILVDAARAFEGRAMWRANSVTVAMMLPGDPRVTAASYSRRT